MFSAQMKKIFLPIILVILTILLLIGIGIAQRSKTDNQNGWETFVSKELGFSISYPKEWTPHEETSNVSFEGKKTKNDPFAPYIRITKNLSGPDIDAVGTFNKIYEASDGSAIESTTSDPVSEVNVTKIENLQVDGAKATKVLEESKMPGPFYAQRVYVLTGNIVWVISNVAPTKEELDARSTTSNEVLTSFEFSTN